jgi:hypothetical protein
MAIKDYSTTPDLNVQISGINIAEGCPPSGINNAIRQLMADVKAEKDTRDAEQAAKDAAQDAAIGTKISSVNGLTPDADGNVDVGGMPLGTAFPYTGKDVPAGTLRADGSTYTNMRASFPDFYAWVVASGLTVALGSYALVEGSCGFYGLDESTGTVRMPTLAAGVFGTTAAGQYGMAVEAGLPNITGHLGHLTSHSTNGVSNSATSALYWTTTSNEGAKSIGSTLGKGFDPGIDASRSSAIYGKSDTVTPSHVKYPWVIVVYNAAVSASVAQAQEFIGLLDGKADKIQLASVVAPGFVMPFAANSTPSGYLLCNGAAVSRTTYAALFSAIGTTYGGGDGSSTFNLPNLTDKFIQGSGTAGTVKAAGLPNITGAFQGDYNAADTKPEGVFYLMGKDVTGNAGGGIDTMIGFNASRSSAIYGASSTVQPPALTMRYYIKY